MKFQIHHQNLKNSKDTVLIKELELFKEDGLKVLGKVITELWISDPPPKGYTFMVCSSKSDYFKEIKDESEEIN